MKKRVKLKDIATHSKGKQINRNDLIKDGEFEYLNGGIYPSGKWIESNVTGNTITISEGGNSSGYVNYMTDAFWCGAHCYYLYDLKCDSRYLYYALKSQQTKIMNLRTGSAMPNLKKSILGDFSFNIDHDPLKQEKVVFILSRIENILNLKVKQIKDFDLLIKTRFVEMFGEPVSNPMNWEKTRLGDECEIVTGNTPSRKIVNYYGDHIEWIKSNNITSTSSFLTFAKEHLSEEGLAVGRFVESGSILMTCIAGSIRSIANVAISDRKVSFNQQINAIVPIENNTWFMYVQFILSQRYIRSTINMSLKGILSKGTLSDLEFIFPSLDLQNEFGSFAQTVDKLKFEVQKSLNQTQQLFDSLMQEYFG